MMESPLTWRNVYAILGAITPHTRRIKDTVSDEDLGLVKLNVELDTYSEKCDESQLVTGFKTGVFNSVCLDEVFKVSPSTNPSDYSAQVFDLLVAELNRIDSHHTYSLASEAEWELAARSKSDGTVETANFPAQWGIDCPSTRHNLGALASVYMENKPNGAGLLRMASPIPEITGDKFIPDYFEKANAADPRTSGANGTNNTVRNASKLEQDIGTKSNALCYTHAFGVRRPIMERTPFDMETVTARLIRRPK